MPRKGEKKGQKQPQRPLLFKEDDVTEYGRVTRILGNGRFTVKMENKEVIGRLCGKFRKGINKKNNIVGIGTVVLVGLRDFQENTTDIIHVYTDEEVRRLVKQGAYKEEIVTEPTVCDDTLVFADEDFDDI